MPQGKETYGSKVGRPPKKKGSLLNDDRERYIFGGVASRAARKGIEKIRSLLGKKVASVEKNKLSEEINIIEDYYDANIMYDFDDTPAARKFNEKIQKKFEELKPKFKKIVETTEGADKLNWESGDLESINKLLDIKEVEIKKLGRVQKQEGGTTEDQMNALAISVAPARVEEQETHTMPDGTEMPGATHEEYEQMLPDEEMEEDYVDYIVESALEEEDQNYLESALMKDAKLSEIFDQVVESASEFSGSGPIEGPGSEISDSIPARLSDGEFVFTAKATEEIGEDNLMSMMKDAEAGADQRQGVVHGGMVDEEERAVPIQTRGSVVAQGNIPNVVKQSRQVEEEMLKSSPRRYYVPVSG